MWWEGTVSHIHTKREARVELRRLSQDDGTWPSPPGPWNSLGRAQREQEASVSTSAPLAAGAEQRLQVLARQKSAWL